MGIRAKKRGQVELMNIILVLVAGIILFAGGFYIYSKLQESGDREVCRVSAEYKTETKIRGWETVSSTLKCKTQNVVVKSDGIYKNGKYIAPFSLKDAMKGADDKRKAQIAITKAIGDQMYDCWYQFRGLDPFAQDISALRCVPCANIIIQPEVANAIPSLPAFYTTLKTFKDQNGTDYLSYITDEKVGFEDLQQDINLGTTSDYTIVFETSKENKLLSEIPIAGPWIAAPSGVKKINFLTNGQGLVQMAQGAAVAGGGGVALAASQAGDLAGVEQELTVFTTDKGVIRYVWDGKQYLMQSTNAATMTSDASEIGSMITNVAKDPSKIEKVIVSINGEAVATKTGTEAAQILSGATDAVGSAETGGVAVSKGFGKLLSKALPEGALAKIAPRFLPTAVELAGKVVFAAAILYTGYDLLQPNDPAVYGIEIVPSNQVAQVCEQFY